MTRSVFVDSFAWIASINRSDNYHDICLKTVAELLHKQVKLFTTNYVILETINALSKADFRKAVIEFVNKLEQSPSVEIITITEDTYRKAWRLYTQRMDKDWGITDCTSFEVMKMYSMKKVFTNYKHFEQAGFSLLIK